MKVMSNSWENPTVDMLDEFDLDKVKYMISPDCAPHMLVLGFSEIYKGQLMCAALVLKKEQIDSPNFNILLEERKARIRTNLANHKKQFDRLKA